MATGLLDPLRASAVVDHEHPWPGLVSYTEDGAAFFFGREREVAELARLVRQDVLTVLFGKSGLGKSSLLRAGLTPVLRESEFLPVFIRLDFAEHAPALEVQVKERIAETLRAERIDAAAPTADETLWEYFHRKGADWWDADNRLLKPVLIFDQFEELLTIGQGGAAQTARTTSFLTELEDLIENRVPSGLQKRFEAERGLARQYDFERVAYRVILSLREDFLADLESLHDRLRQIISNRFRLLPMSGSQAMDVILKPQANLVAEDVAVEIVHFVSSSERSRLQAPVNRGTLANRQVEPALLSVVLRELNNHRIESGASTITADLVSGQRATEILERFFERGVEGLGDHVREFILDQMLTSSGARNRVAEEDALSKYGIPPETIATLIDRRILQRQLSGSVKWLELTHDTLADVVRAHRAEQTQRRAVAEAAAREAAVRKQLAKTHRLIATFALLLLIAGAGLGFAVYSQMKLSASNRSLEEQQRVLAATNTRLNEQQNALKVASAGLAGKNDELRVRAEAEAAAIVNQLRAQLDEWNAGAGPRVLEQLARITELHAQFDSPSLARARALAGVFGAETLFVYGYIGDGLKATAGARDVANQLSTTAPDDPAIALVMAGVKYAAARGASQIGRDLEADGLLSDGERLIQVALRGEGSTAIDARRIGLLLQYLRGDFLYSRGVIDKAHASLEGLLAALDKAPTELAGAAAYLRVSTLTQLGFMEDDFSKSLPYYTRGLAVVREQSTRNPDNLRWPKLRADIAYRQAFAMMNSGRFDETKRLLEEAKNASDAVFQADRDDRRTAYTRGLVGAGLVQMYQKSGEAPRAEAALREAMATMSGLARQEPSWISPRSVEGILHGYAADMAGQRARVATAAADQTREQSARDKELAVALQLFQGVARDQPSNAENRRNIALTAHSIGIDRSARKDYAAAMGSFTQARQAIEQIPAAVRARPRFQANLSDNLKLVGFYAHTPSGNREQAQQAFTEAVRIDTAITVSEPTPGNFIRLGETYRTLGDSYLGQGAIERTSDAFAQSLAAYDRGLARFPADEGVGRAKAEMAYYFATRWRAAKRPDFALAALTVAVDSAIKILENQPLQADVYDLLEKAGTEAEEIRKLTAGTASATTGARPVTAAQIDALRGRALSGRSLLPTGITTKERSSLNLARSQQWPIPPLVPGAWRQLPRDEQNAETVRLRAGNAFEKRVAANVVRIRTLPLSFYEGATLYEVESTVPAGTVYDYVRLAGRPDFVLEINGLSAPIHALNRSGSLRLDSADQAAQYMRFFMNAITGVEGNFRVVDSNDDLRFLASAPADLPARLGRFIVPLEIRRNQEGKWDARATVRYSNAMFYAILRVDNLIGNVAMTEDEPIAADLPVLFERFDESRRSLAEVSAKKEDWDKKLSEERQKLTTLLANTSPLTPERREELCGAYLGVSWYQLHVKDFAGALTSTEAGLKLDPNYIPLETNRAHALVFLGRLVEADAIYRQYIGKMAQGKPWEDVIIEDLDTLEKDGVSHAHFARVREIVKVQK
jgi:tetratricopeptide (TPR) repeat protein